MISRVKQFLAAGLTSLLFINLAPSVWAQSRVELTGQILDPQKAAIMGAEVTLTNPAGKSFDTKTDNQGRFRLTKLNAGTYQLTVYAEGFALYQDENLKLDQTPQEPLVIELQVTLTENIEVNEDDRQISVDPDKNGSAIVLTEEDLEALPDDPDDLLQALKDLAGPAAGVDDVSVYVNGFAERGAIPPKHAILRIMINNSPYSAEFSEPGFGRIQIMTKPGTDIVRAGMNFSFNDESLNARDPFAPNRAPQQVRNYGGYLTGPIIKNRASYFIDLHRREGDSSDTIAARILDPTTLEPVDFRASVANPTRSSSFDIRNDIQLNKTNTMTLGYRYSDRTRANQGVGGFELPENGFNSTSTEHRLRLSEMSIINAKMVNEFRLQLARRTSGAAALSTDPQIVVQQSFTGGGAQGSLFSQRVNNDLDLNNNLSLTLGNHSIKTGVQLNLTNLQDTNRANYGGTFTFQNLQQYREALTGQPNARALQYTINRGIPSASSTVWQLGWYMLDDWKVRPNLTLSGGLRQEVQTHLQDKLNLSPRVSLAWSPGGGQGQRPSTVIRAGFGLFYNWLNEGTLLSVARTDGQHLITTVIPCASFPNPLPTDPLTCPNANLRRGARAAALPTIRTFQTDLKMPYTIQWSAGVDRQLPAGLQLSVNYSRVKAVHMFRSRNINAPLPGTGLIPDPTQGPTLQLESTGNFIRHILSLGVNRRMSQSFSVFGNYVLGRSFSDYAGGGGGFGGRLGGGGGGGFSLPTNSYDLTSDWSRADGDARHNVRLGGMVNLPFGVRVMPMIAFRSSIPFNITTGRDNNGDTHINDRPAFADEQTRLQDLAITPFGRFDMNPKPGQTIIPRNYGIGPSMFNVDLRLNKTFGWGEQRTGGWQTPNGESGDGPRAGGGRGAMRGGAGGMRGGRGGGGRGGRGGGEGSYRYTFTFGLDVNNLFNQVNYSNFNGVLPQNPAILQAPNAAQLTFFGRANRALEPRRVEASLRFRW